MFSLMFVASAGIACGPNHRLPEGYQGVVEHDERLVAFEVVGRVARVPVKRGDAIKEGDVLAVVDDTLERLTRDARADELRGAQADLALLEAGSRREDIASLAAQLRATEASEGLAKKAAERARSLRESGAVAQAELDRAEADLGRVSNERASVAQRVASLQRGARPEEITRAKARVEGANAALALAEERLARHVLKAGVGGAVLDVYVDPGELAAAGAPALALADTAHPYVDVFVPEGEIGGLRVGSKAHIKVDAERATFAGSIEHVFSRAEFTPKFLFSERERPNIVIRVRVRIDDPERRIHAGVPAFARIER